MYTPLIAMLVKVVRMCLRCVIGLMLFLLRVFIVKATSVICLLGVGVGLGSLLVYKLYTHFFLRDRRRPSNKKKKGKSTRNIGGLDCTSCTQSEYLLGTRDHISPEVSKSA